jgi:protein-S-isoprenylcysteine O-methyltransferase Ste14
LGGAGVTAFANIDVTARREGDYHTVMSNLYLRAIRATLVGFVAMFALIFIPAWTLGYWQGWAFLLTLAGSTIPVTIYIALHDKRLLESRLRIGPTAEKTSAQKIITAIGAAVFVAGIFIMVFDHRFGWSPPVPAYVSIFGDAFVVLCILVYFFVVKENRYAAAVVEVVEGQTVVSTGPYAIVRHPMYSGAILFFIGMPLALGSWWGLLFIPLVVAGFAWRLLDEEELLKKDLRGYTEYTHNVRYRLVPYFW